MDLPACLSIFDDGRHDGQGGGSLANEYPGCEDLSGLLLSSRIEILCFGPASVALTKGVAPDDSHEAGTIVVALQPGFGFLNRTDTLLRGLR